ncbi:unnamed protein product [Thlaspi arvense]|uniref:Arabinogalactan-like protein n=1 Tax=Thlaspi arvense TaxID=13288 RepID=A0AAU9RG92_THLAR|nr:unnamed protein product [Thlaspi arvense]
MAPVNEASDFHCYNQVNISTGVVNATVDNTIYTDSKLAVYQVNQVLLPLSLFGSPAPAPAPATAPEAPKKKKAKVAAASPSADLEPSGAASVFPRGVVAVGVAAIVGAFAL